MPAKFKLFSSKPGYNLAAPYYDQKEKFLNSFEKGKILPLLGDLKDKKVLEVGAGTGRLTVQLQRRGAKVTALDISPQMLSVLAQKNKDTQTVVGDAANLPFGAGDFDIVLAAFLIVHLKDPTVFFSEAYRVLKDGGRFLVTNINQRRPPPVKTKQGGILIQSYYHRPEQIRGLLEALAFKIEKEIFVKEGEAWVNQIILARK